MKQYSPKDIEPKWQKYWDENQTYKADLNSTKPKYIGMSMFNYPSGAGIHIGHAMNYTISDVMARFKRQQGFESYHPVGWDAFGLPAENYAIKAGVSPQESMAKIIPDYHKQYKAMGWSNDWSKEIATHEPKYYKWSQWIFTQMHKHGMAYQDSRMQWWCEKDNTVLANEQVIDGKCWRHDGPDDPLVEKKEIKQWFFKITDYADELLEATDALDWTESVKMAQKNWIGRSEGINIEYEVVGTDKKITCFTTTPVNYGMTFIVIAPEHDMVSELTTPEQKEAVEAYVEVCIKKTDVERQQEGKEKTGVFTGAYAKNQLTGENVPIWVADFVLAAFGTGVVQGCPAHDERDFEFAAKFGLPIIRVVEGPNGETAKIVDPNTETVDQVKLNHGIKAKMINSGQFDGLVFDEGMQKTMDFFEAQGWGKRTVNYKLRDWSVGRQRYWGAPIPIINCEKCGQVLVPEDQLPVVLPELKDFQPNGDGRSALARATEWLKVPCPQCGGEGERETDTLDTYICSSWYMMRYLDPDNDKAPFGSDVANKWMPVDFYNGADHATAHMIYARFVTRFFHKMGMLDNPEPFKKFLYNGKVTAANGEMFSKSKGTGVDPLEIIGQGYGADALRTYLMFAAPLDLWVKWDPKGVPGSYRFINRVWNIVQEFLEAEVSEGANGAVLQAIHPAIKKVTEDLEAQKYNTAIATLMKATNDLYEIKAKGGFEGQEDWRFALESLVSMIAPFAPHAAEELWHDMGHEDTVQRGHWPVFEEKYLFSSTMTIAIQVNGKLRATIDIASDASKEDIIAAAQNDEKIKAHLDGEPKKTIYVPGKLVSFVV
jgi:leucyl-tRNA synthetase